LPKRTAALCLALLPLLAASGEDPLELSDLDGRPASIALAPGETAVVVHFWATWCPECVAELPILARAARSCAGAPVRILAVNVGESAEQIVRWRAEHAFELPVLRDPKGKVWRSVARGLPANLAWTSDGLRSDLGERSEPEWRETLAAFGCKP
jgi:thiol-disulfide isomerase/thioredoxin